MIVGEWHIVVAELQRVRLRADARKYSTEESHRIVDVWYDKLTTDDLFASWISENNLSIDILASAKIPTSVCPVCWHIVKPFNRKVPCPAWRRCGARGTYDASRKNASESAS